MNYLRHLQRQFNVSEIESTLYKLASQKVVTYEEHKPKKLDIIMITREHHPEKGSPYRKDHKWISIRDNENKEIGYCSYKPSTGQIGSFIIDEKYRYQGIGKKVLEMCIEDMKKEGANEVWGVTSAKEFSEMTTFKGKIHYRNPAHPSVTGDGYFMKI